MWGRKTEDHKSLAPTWLIALAVELANASLMFAVVLLGGAVMVYWVRPAGHVLANYKRAHYVSFLALSSDR